MAILDFIQDFTIAFWVYYTPVLVAMFIAHRVATTYYLYLYGYPNWKYNLLPFGHIVVRFIDQTLLYRILLIISVPLEMLAYSTMYPLVILIFLALNTYNNYVFATQVLFLDEYKMYAFVPFGKYKLLIDIFEEQKEREYEVYE